MKKLILIFTALMLVNSCSYTMAEPSYQQLDQTTANLGISGVYTSPVFASHTFESINVNVTSDQDSASEGLKINYVSTTGDCSTFTPTSSNMDYTANNSGWSYTASVKNSYESSVRGNCAWVTYTNGGVAQTSFRMTIFGNFK